MNVVETLKSYANSGEDPEYTCDTSDEDPREDDDTDSEKEYRVTTEEDEYASHTVHLAKAEFTDGREKWYMFDCYKRDNGAIILGDYKSYNDYASYRYTAWKTTISLHNIYDFTTVQRRIVRKKVDSKQNEETVTETQLSELREYCINKDHKRIVNVEEE